MLERFIEEFVLSGERRAGERERSAVRLVVGALLAGMPREVEEVEDELSGAGFADFVVGAARYAAGLSRRLLRLAGDAAVATAAALSGSPAMTTLVAILNALAVAMNLAQQGAPEAGRVEDVISRRFSGLGEDAKAAYTALLVFRACNAALRAAGVRPVAHPYVVVEAYNVLGRGLADLARAFSESGFMVTIDTEKRWLYGG